MRRDCSGPLPRPSLLPPFDESLRVVGPEGVDAEGREAVLVAGGVGGPGEDLHTRRVESLDGGRGEVVVTGSDPRGPLSLCEGREIHVPVDERHRAERGG